MFENYSEQCIKYDLVVFTCPECEQGEYTIEIQPGETDYIGVCPFCGYIDKIKIEEEI